jgi:hypothetical protein
MAIQRESVAIAAEQREVGGPRSQRVSGGLEQLHIHAEVWCARKFQPCAARPEVPGATIAQGATHERQRVAQRGAARPRLALGPEQGGEVLARLAAFDGQVQQQRQALAGGQHNRGPAVSHGRLPECTDNESRHDALAIRAQ